MSYLTLIIYSLEFIVNILLFCSFDGKQLKMSEDHRITSDSERQRFNEIGEPLKDGDTRLCGIVVFYHSCFFGC